MRSYIYFIKDPVTQEIKIGFSANPKGRRDALQTGNPRELIHLGEIPGKKADEASFHRRFAAHRLDHGGGTEWFAAEIIEEVLNIISAHKEYTRQIRRKTMTDITGKEKGDDGSVTDMTGNDKEPTDKDSGIRGMSRIPGLRLKFFSLKLTERPYEHQKGWMVCGFELQYLLEFETSVSNEVAANQTDLQQLPQVPELRHNARQRGAETPTNPTDLQQLQKALLTLGAGTGLKHKFFDKDNAIIPFSPGHNDYHIVGGPEAITGEEGDAFRVLVAFEKPLNPAYAHAKIKDVFMGENYAGEHPLKNAAKLVIALR